MKKKVKNWIIGMVMVILLILVFGGLAKIEQWSLRKTEENMEVYEFQEGSMIELGEGIDADIFYCYEGQKHLPECYKKVIKNEIEDTDITKEQYQVLVQREEKIEDWVNNLSTEELMKLAQLIIDIPPIYMEINRVDNG